MKFSRKFTRLMLSVGIILSLSNPVQCGTGGSKQQGTEKSSLETQEKQEIHFFDQQKINGIQKPIQNLIITKGTDIIGHVSYIMTVNSDHIIMHELVIEKGHRKNGFGCLLFKEFVRRCSTKKNGNSKYYKKITWIAEALDPQKGMSKAQALPGIITWYKNRGGIFIAFVDGPYADQQAQMEYILS